MIDFAIYLIIALIAYLLGSLCFGVWLVNLSIGKDVRSQGSKKTGMTNVVRIAGVKIGAIVLILDITKSIVAVCIARVFVGDYFAESIAAIFAVVGHCWPVFGKFSGGRGTASGLGALVFISPLSGLLVIVIGLILLFSTRYVSLASIVGAIIGAVMVVILVFVDDKPMEYLLFAVIVPAIILLMHKGNMQRLIKGNERKFCDTNN